MARGMARMKERCPTMWVACFLILAQRRRNLLFGHAAMPARSSRRMSTDLYRNVEGKLRETDEFFCACISAVTKPSPGTYGTCRVHADAAPGCRCRHWESFFPRPWPLEPRALDFKGLASCFILFLLFLAYSAHPFAGGPCP